MTAKEHMMAGFDKEEREASDLLEKVVGWRLSIGPGPDGKGRMYTISKPDRGLTGCCLVATFYTKKRMLDYVRGVVC